MPTIDIPEPRTVTVELIDNFTDEGIGVIQTPFVPAVGDTCQRVTKAGKPATWKVVHREWDLDLSVAHVTLYVEPVRETNGGR